ncbi:hypothetical protein [Streptomyces sp. IBSBF 3136]|uniref:hypothetical protein n=1 Tax=Streptomyces sp. IBSBF 3136 TaxID=2903524 RepID=UPI002FDC557F
MVKRPECPRPPGAPRWVAMFHRPSDGSWRVAAESPDRAPVLYAVGDMAQTVRARGDEVTVALWGPRDGTWHHFETPAAPGVPATAEIPAADPSPERARKPGERADEPVKLAERMADRRHQVLMAGLSRAGLYDLSPEDESALQALVDRLDEPTARRVAHWLSAAAAGRRAAGEPG